MSTTSWTSPRASASGLPTSRVTVRASASALASTRRPSLCDRRAADRRGRRRPGRAGRRGRARRRRRRSRGRRGAIVATTSRSSAGLRALEAAAGGPGRGTAVEQGGEVGHAGRYPPGSRGGSWPAEPATPGDVACGASVPRREPVGRRRRGGGLRRRAGAALRDDGLGRHARRGRRARARAGRVGRRVAPHPRGARRRRVPRRALAAGARAVARARPGLVAPAGVVWLARRADGWEAASERTLRALGVPCERVDPAALFPSFAGDDLAFALLEPEAGVLRARDATRALAGRRRGPRRTAGGGRRAARRRGGGPRRRHPPGGRPRGVGLRRVAAAAVRRPRAPARHPAGRVLPRGRRRLGDARRPRRGSTTTAPPTAWATSTGAA